MRAEVKVNSRNSTQLGLLGLGTVVVTILTVLVKYCF
jgi:hypothetical protein